MSIMAEISEYRWYERIYLRLKHRGKFLPEIEKQVTMQYKDKEELEVLQLQRLKAIVLHAYKNVPFYRAFYEEHHFNPEKIFSLKDIKKIPIITKDDLRKAGQRAYADGIEKRFMLKDKTSGSTNEPFEFFKDKRTMLTEHACFMRHKLVAGYKFLEPSVLMRGLEPHKSAIRAVMDKTFSRNYFISLLDLDDITIPKHVEFLKEKKIRLIECFPSGVVELARYIKDQQIEMHIPYIIASGEKLSQKDQELIENAFNGKVYQVYGSAENMEVAYQCDERNGFHYDISRYVLDEENGELIITNLENYVMPFIRYKSGDQVVFDEKACTCGRNFPLIKEIKGRVLHNIQAPNGKILNYHFFSTLLDKDYQYIHKYQVVHKDNGALEVLIVPGESWNDEVKSEILRTITDQTGPDMEVRIIATDRISAKLTGKRELMSIEK